MKRNPVHTSGKKFRYTIDDGQRVPIKADRGKLTKRQRKEFSRTVNYMERVEKMRPYFGDLFKASNGYNLHDIENWTPQQKAKVTRYWRVIAPRIQSDHIEVKRYRRKDHLKAAVEATLQEEFLPGQKAAIFTVQPEQKVNVKFTRDHKPIVTRDGITEQKISFDKHALAEDWRKEVERVLNLTDAKYFKLMTGAHRSNETYTRDQLIDRVIEYQTTYDVDRPGAAMRFESQHWEEWLNGIIAFKGTTMREMRMKDKIHKEQMELRRLEKARERAKKARIMDRSAKLTGRSGRVK